LKSIRDIVKHVWRHFHKCLYIKENFTGKVRILARSYNLTHYWRTSFFYNLNVVYMCVHNVYIESTPLIYNWFPLFWSQQQ